MKKYLFLALAVFGLVSCVDNESDNNSPVHSGEIEESYIAINLSASGTTRAKTGYDDGTEAERAVSHADFFFFDEEGNDHGILGSNQFAQRDDMTVTVCGNDDRIVLISRFDNLGKGASGAAVQNFNLVTGQPETAGLKLGGDV